MSRVLVCGGRAYGDRSRVFSVLDKYHAEVGVDLCFTVWSICHNPTHEDGNADWLTETSENGWMESAWWRAA